jgi:hypothetical protein
MPAVQESRARLTLRDVMKELHLLSRDEWLFIDASTERITLDLVCSFVATDDYLDDELNSYCDQNGLKHFFYKDQLRDIKSNLSAQRTEFTESDLEKAIDYYWQNDAFIHLYLKT